MTNVFAHSPAPQFSDPDLCCTGMAPSARALGAARATMLNAGLYKGHGLLSIAERANADSGGSFYVFYPAITPEDGTDTIRIMIDVRMSNYGSGTTAGTITVTDYSGTTLDSVSYSGVTSSTATFGNVEAKGFSWTAYVEAPTTSLGYYQWLKVAVSAGYVISCVATTVPKPSTSSTIDSVRGLGGGNFQAGAPLIGYDRTTPTVSGSVDSIVQYQVTRGAATEPTWTAASKRCLWGWSTAHGRYYVHPSSSGYKAMMSASFRPLVQPRNLRASTGSVAVDVCVMYRADSGAKIKFTSSVDSLEMSLTAATTTTPAAQYDYGGLLVAATGDEITIEVYATTSAAVEIKALAIFDGAET